MAPALTRHGEFHLTSPTPGDDAEHLHTAGCASPTPCGGTISWKSDDPGPVLPLDVRHLLRTRGWAPDDAGDWFCEKHLPSPTI